MGPSITSLVKDNQGVFSRNNFITIMASYYKNRFCHLDTSCRSEGDSGQDKCVTTTTQCFRGPADASSSQGGVCWEAGVGLNRTLLLDDGELRLS